MRCKHQNLSAGAWSRAPWIAASALLSIASIGGLLIRPVASLERAEAEGAHKRQDAQACRAERVMLQRYEEAHGWERTAEALRSLSAKLPKDPSPIEIQGVLRLLANARRIELGSANIAAATPTSFAVLDDCVMMREVDLCGRGTLADWVGLREDLERCGYPNSVLEFSLVRTSTPDSAFDVHLVLGLYSSFPVATKPSAGRSGGAG